MCPSCLVMCLAMLSDMSSQMMARRSRSTHSKFKEDLVFAIHVPCTGYWFLRVGYCSSCVMMFIQDCGRTLMNDKVQHDTANAEDHFPLH